MGISESLSPELMEIRDSVLELLGAESSEGDAKYHGNDEKEVIRARLESTY